MDLDDIKWKQIESTSREIAYYCHKITGQQKWTNKNCYCSKPKDPLRPTLPCCYKKHSPSSPAKGLTEDSHDSNRGTRFQNALSTKKLYSLSDIVNEVQKSFLVRRPKSYIYKGKGKRKRKSRKNNKTLDLKNDKNTTEGPISCVNIPLDPKHDIIGTINNDITSPDNDVNTNKDSRNKANVTESTKEDVVVTKDLVNDVNGTEDPKYNISNTKNSIHEVMATKDPKHDVSTARQHIHEVIATKDPKLDVTTAKQQIHEVIATKDPNLDVTTAKQHTHEVIATKDSKHDVSNAKQQIHEVIATKDPKLDVTAKQHTHEVIATKDPKHDVSTAKQHTHEVIATKDSKHYVSTAMETKTDVILIAQHVDSRKTEENVPPNNRILKRKREVIDNVNGYKSRLRVRRNKIEVAYRRKYRRKNVFKSALSGEPAHLNTNDSSSKEENLESVDKKLHESCDLLEQSIIEIVQFTSDNPYKVDPFCSDLGARSLSSERTEKQLSEANPESRTAENNPDNVPNAVEVRPRFVNEEFIQMNKPCVLTKTGKKELKKRKIADIVIKKWPVSQRNYPKQSSSETSPNSTSKRQTIKEPSNDLDLDNFDFVPLITQGSSLLTSEAIKTQIHSAKTEHINQEHSSHVLNISPNSNQCKRPLHTIVKHLKEKHTDAAMPLKSTVSKGRWSTILSKGAKKIKNSLNTEGGNLSTDGDTSNPEQGDHYISSNNSGNESPESDSPFSHIKNTLNITGVPKAQSGKPVSHFSETQDTNNAKSVRKGKVNRGVGTHDATTQGMNYPMVKLGDNVTEVPASYVDLSWRIVTSSQGHSASLHNFFKLVPVVISRGPCGIIDKQEPMSFLGVPIYGGPQIIAKILNTSIPEKCNEIFKVTCKPVVNKSNICTTKMTLSFVWENGVVRLESDLIKAGGLSGEDIKPRSPVWIDISNKISMVLPKPLRLPVAGNVIYFGDFNVKSCYVEFVVTHSVMVTKSPRPSLSIPSGTPMNSTSTACQTIRCRSPGETRNDVETVKAVPVSKKIQQEDEKLFRKCVFCGNVLKCRRDVKLHRKLHVSFIGTKCSECKRRFNNGGRLSVHIVTHKCHWHHICEKCKRVYRTPKFLSPEDLAKDYYKMCLSCRRKELKCKKCTERCMTFEELDAHIKKMHGPKCSICQSSFLCKLDLKKHMMSQHKIESLPPSLNTGIGS